MGPEMRTDPTAATATNTIATRNGTSCLAPWLRDDGVSSTDVGIVVVLMAFLAFRARGQAPCWWAIRCTALIRIKHIGTVMTCAASAIELPSQP
jgi:hypothetical protein